MPPYFRQALKPCPDGAQGGFATASRENSRQAYFSGCPHIRHWSRRRAFKVPQLSQRLYIFRANQCVTTALTPSTPMKTTRLRSVSTLLTWIMHEEIAAGTSTPRSAPKGR